MANENLDAFWSLIDGAGTCMMTTRDQKALRSRPMRPIVDEATHEFLFLTRLSSHKTDELAANPAVNLAFSNQDAGEFVSVSGQAYLTQDRQLIDRLWTSAAEFYFQCGKDDSDIAVIRVVPSMAEYWDATSTLRQAWNVFKARLTDEQPERGSNLKVAFRG